MAWTCWEKKYRRDGNEGRWNNGWGQPEKENDKEKRMKVVGEVCNVDEEMVRMQKWRINGRDKSYRNASRFNYKTVNNYFSFTFSSVND